MSFVAAATWSAGRPSRSSSDLRCGQTAVHDSQIPRRIDFSMCVDVGVPQHDLVFSSPLVSIVFSSLCCRPGEPHDSSEGNLINLKCHRDELGPWRAPSRHPGAMAIAVETHKCRRPAGDRKWRLEKSLSTPATPPHSPKRKPSPYLPFQCAHSNSRRGCSRSGTIRASNNTAASEGFVGDASWLVSVLPFPAMLGQVPKN